MFVFLLQALKHNTSALIIEAKDKSPAYTIT